MPWTGEHGFGLSLVADELQARHKEMCQVQALAGSSRPTDKPSKMFTAERDAWEPVHVKHIVAPKFDKAWDHSSHSH